MKRSSLTGKRTSVRRAVALVVGSMLTAHGSVALAASSSVDSWAAQPLSSSILHHSTTEAEECSYGVALAVSGRTALVGGPRCPRAGMTTGEVFVFEHDGSEWVERAPISAPTGRRGFGSVLAVSNDFYTVSSSDDGATAAPVRIVPRAHPEQASDLPFPEGEVSPFFGYALALQGTTLLVGDPGTNGGAGSVVVYRFEDGAWSARQSLPALGDGLTVAEAYLGSSLALEGNTAFVGAPFEGGRGAVYAFERENDAADFALVPGAIEAPAGSSAFGTSIAIEPTSDTVAIGDPGFDDSAGIVHMFVRSGNAWAQQAPSLDSGTEAGPALEQDSLGTSLSFARGVLFASAPSRVQDKVKGMVLVFTAQAQGWSAQGALSPDAVMGLAVAGSIGGSLVASAFGSVYGYTLVGGVECDSLSDCQSGFCSDGVCCNGACDGTCESCLGRDTGDADGVCGLVLTETDPKEECDVSELPCGETGVCDGRGACAVATLGYPCSASYCSSTTEVMPGGRCDGQGDCVALEGVSCAEGYACSKGACERQKVESSPIDECGATDGFYVLEGACVSGAQCASDGTAAFDEHGIETACGIYRCVDGACRSSCRSGRVHCANDYTCDSERSECIPMANFARGAVDDSSITCGFVRKRSFNFAWPSTLLLALLLRRRKLVRSNKH